MRACVARRTAAMGLLLLLVVAPAKAHHPGGGGNTGSGGPINTISAGTLAECEIAAAVRCEFIRLGQLDDDALLAAAEPGKHGHSIESVSLSAAYSITNDFMVRPRPNDDVVVGDARPGDGSRTAVERRFV
jgi:hypothetical protein